MTCVHLMMNQAIICTLQLASTPPQICILRTLTYSMNHNCQSTMTFVEVTISQLSFQHQIHLILRLQQDRILQGQTGRCFKLYAQLN